MTYNYKLSASEELSDHFIDIPLVDSYHYVKIGATTVGQLEKSGLFPKKVYGKKTSNKPDGLILFGKNEVKVLIEAKPPKGIIRSKDSAKNIITSWYYDLAQNLDCNIIIATDNAGGNTYWFNNQGQEIKENGEPVRHILNINSKSTIEEKQDLTDLIKRCANLDSDGNIIPEKTLNPTNLANRVWQKIWISTGKEPEKCLYNVVEIFIFKFLSDLGVLKTPRNFEFIYNLSLQDKQQALQSYASTIRNHIKKEMFPASQDDHTTIFNGTIFVNEKGEANPAQAGLFAQIIKEFADYDKEFGSFNKIDKQFKTRLYESFLRQSAGVAALGQYFTPRNVVKAIIDMIGRDVKDDIKICDPFCGVGGFLLEFINNFPNIKNQFIPKNQIITLQTEIIGYDKGSDEKDDERTIILAKANMLIYLSDLIAKYANCTQEFSNKAFNQTFHLVKDNLGTFSKDNHSDYFDLILTNPPYVTSGVATIKKEIAERGLSETFPSNGNGLEGLAIEWIINALKPKGRAFLIVPDGLFTRSSDKTLRDKILDTCEITGVISLPSRTFFATPKKTYILAITKKDKKYTQTIPIFTYLISEIGETKDAKRFEEPGKNDLTIMSKLYKQFMSTPNDFTTTDPRCKTQHIDRLKEKNWLIDRDWTSEEKNKLGIEDDITEISESEFNELVKDIQQSLSNFVLG